MTSDVLSNPSVPHPFSTAAVNVDGRDHSLREFLTQMQRRGQLRNLLSQWAIEQIIRSEAELRGIRVSAEMLQKAADGVRRSERLFSAEATQEWLSRHGLNVLDFEDELESRLLKSLVFQTLTDHAQEHFNRSSLLHDRIMIRMIVVEREGLADEIRTQILDENQDFSALATEYSVHASANAGGQVNEMSRGDLKQLIGAHAYNAGTGDLIGPLPVNGGWILLTIVSVKPAVFDVEMERVIRQDLFEQWLSARIPESKISFPLLDLLSCSNDS